VAWSGAGARGKKLNEAQPVWQEGIGSFLRLSAAQQTGLLDRLVTAVRGLADPTIPGLGPPNPAVVEREVTHVALSARSGFGPHLGFTGVYRNDVSEAFGKAPGLQSALY
jgi:hypothetical protein